MLKSPMVDIYGLIGFPSNRVAWLRQYDEKLMFEYARFCLQEWHDVGGSRGLVGFDIGKQAFEKHENA